MTGMGSATLPAETYPTQAFVRVGRLYFDGPHRRRGITLLGVVLVLCVAKTALLVWLSYTQRDLGTALQKKDQDGYYKAIWQFLGVVVIAAPLFAYYQYMQELLALEWRVWLTGHLMHRYYTSRAYLHLKAHAHLDNPDQRICDDVRSFVDGMVLMTTLLLSKILNCAAFITVLWSISPSLVMFLVVYAAAGTLATTQVFGSKLKGLTYTLLQRSADLRFCLVRARENAESIAFFAGEANESATAQRRLARLAECAGEAIVWSRHLALFTDSYHYLTLVLPGLIVAPRYFRGEVEFGVISQASFAFSSIFSALTLVVTRFAEISGMAAQVNRIDAMLRSMDEAGCIATRRLEARTVTLERSTMDTFLEIRGLRLTLPDSQRPVWYGSLHLHLAMGQRLLIMGPSGCGKSTLLRAVAGLWDWGEGTIAAPPMSQCSFIPQRTYMPIGSLRDALLFGHSGSLGLLSDRQLVDSLYKVDLQDVLDRAGGLDEHVQLSDVLSLGEQQRLSFARILLRSTRYVFVDEGTSAMDVKSENRMYALLASHTGSFVSVGHRLSLVEHHTHILWLGNTANDVNRGWVLQSVEDFEQPSPYQ